MPRSNASRMQPKVVDSFSVTPAELQAQVKRQDAEMQRRDDERNKPAPRPGVGTIHQEIVGEKEHAPLMGDVIGPLHDYVDEIVFHVQSRPIGRVHRAELHCAMDPDANWGIETGPMPPDRYGYPRRPPVVQPTMSRAATPEERRSAIHNTRMEVTVALPGPPAPRFPQYVRVLVWPLQRSSHAEYDVSVELRHIEQASDTPNFPDRVRVPQGSSFELEVR
jgi:hypothetical protein